MSDKINTSSFGRRELLKTSAGLLAGGAILSGSASARARDSPTAVAIRGTRSSPLTRSDIRDAVEDVLSDAGADPSEARRDQLRQYDVCDKGDLVAFNVIMNDGVPSVYYGIRGRRGDGQPGNGRRSAASQGDRPDHENIHQNADEHLEAKKQAANGGVSVQSTDEFERVSDVRLDYESEEISPSEAQFRIYEEEWNDDPDVKVYLSRVDQRLADYIDSTWQGEMTDATVTHDYNEDNGAKLEDWSPAGSDEQSGGGSATIAIGPSGPSVSYTYDYSQEEVTVSDSSPFGDETSKADIDVPSSGTTPLERYRAENASMGLLDEFSPGGGYIPDPHVWTRLDGGFMYPISCGRNCRMGTEEFSLSYNFSDYI